MKRFEPNQLSHPSRIIGIVLVTLLSLSLNLDAATDMTAQQPNKGVILQQKRTQRVEKAQDLAKLGDRLRSLINALNDVLKNPKIVTNAETRKEALAWAQAINQNLFKVVEKLRSKKIPSTAVLKESAASISLYLDVLYEGIVKGLPKTILNAPEIPKTVIEEKLKFLLEQMQNYLAQTLATQRSEFSEVEQKMLPETINDDMVDMAILDQFTIAINKGLDNLAELIQDYGITKINRTARFLDQMGRKAIYNAYIPYIGVSAFFAGAAYLGYKMSLVPSAHFGPGMPIGMWADVLHGSMGHALAGAGGALVAFAWKPTLGYLNEIKNRMAIWWKKCQGIPVKQKVNGFDILKPEDCEGEDEPHIGLEIPFERVMDSIRSALTRMQNGEREPLKGIQRTYVFLARAGMGKTYLMEGLKREIARLNEFGVEIAYENVQGDQLIFGDLIGRIKEAQQKNMGLVMWIDEVHLFKPHKDGHQPLLAQLLQTEFINNSNTPIWIFAATNEPGRFDNALVRSGRFEIINIYEPTFTDRMRLFDYYLRQQGVVLSPADLALFAAETHNASPATIRKIINSARASGIALTRELIQEKILEFAFKIAPGFESLQVQEQREIATYQSAKLLVHVLNALEYDKNARKQFLTGRRFALGTAASIEKELVELAGWAMEGTVRNINFDNGRRTFGGLFYYSYREINQALGVREKELFVSTLLAGSCAQELLLSDIIDTMRQDDVKAAFEYCLDLARNGLPLEKMSKKDQEACRNRATDIFTAAKHHAMELLKTHSNILKAMIGFMLQAKEYPHITALDVIMLLEKKAPDTHKDKDETKAAETDAATVTLETT